MVYVLNLYNNKYLNSNNFLRKKQPTSCVVQKILVYLHCLKQTNGEIKRN